MLTLTRRRWGVYIVLAHEGVSERGIHGPLARSLRTGRCRMSGLGAGCPAAHEEPDVRASAGCLGWSGQFFCSLDNMHRISGQAPDVRPVTGRRMSGGRPDVRSL